MKQIPGWMMRHKVIVEPYLGTNARGEVYGPGIEIRCMFSESHQMVRNASGEQVSSGSSYIAAPDHLPPENSRVTVPHIGAERKIVSVSRATWPGMSVPANTEVRLN